MPHTISRTATAEKRTEERIFPFARSLSADRLRNDLIRQYIQKELLLMITMTRILTH